MNPDLKPCPFCGGTNIDRLRSGLLYWLHCEDCGGDGPTASTKLGAVEAWNKREGGPNASV